jgi:hypothetical protein
LEEEISSGGDGNEDRRTLHDERRLGSTRRKGSVAHFLENGVQLEMEIEDCIRDEVLKIVF